MRNLMLACAAFAVISAIVSVNLWRELGAEREQTSQLRAQLAAASATPAVQVPLAAAAPQAAPSTAAPADTAAVAPAAPATAVRAVPDVVSQALSRQQELLKDPEYREAMLAQTMGTMAQMFPGLAEELGLSAEENDKLLRLLAEQQMDQRNQLAFRGGAPDTPEAAQEFTRRLQENQQRQNEAVAALLGPGKAQQFQDFRETQGSRMQAAEYGRNLLAAGMPLSTAQQRALTGALIAEQRSFQQEMRSLVPQGNVAGMDAETRSRLLEQTAERQVDSRLRALEVAKAHLSAAQFEKLQKDAENQAVMNRASRRLMQRQMEVQEATGQGVAAGAGQVIIMP